MLGLAGRFVIALWHVVGLLLIVLLVIELGVEGWRRASRRLRYRRARLPDRAALADAQAGADWTVGYFDEFYRSVRVDWKPYVEWWQRPFRGRYVTLDERGLRPTPGEDTAGSNAIRVLCFGGSTMMGLGARDAATIPALLARHLREQGHDVVVVNYGQLGHNSTQETITLQQLLKSGERFDIAVFYDGINEMLSAEQSGEAGNLFNGLRRRAEFNLLHEQRRCDLVTAAALSLLPRTMRRLRRLTGAALRGPLPPADADLARLDIPKLAAAIANCYAANLRLVRVVAAEYGVRPLFFWQPVITTKREKSADEQRFERDYTTSVSGRRALYSAVIDAYRRHPEVADAMDTIDLSALFDDRREPIYIDAYHLSEAGNAAVAEAMLASIAAALTSCR